MITLVRNIREGQKELELRIAKSFLEELAVDGDYVFVPSERPDFYTTGAKPQLGIELTQVFWEKQNQLDPQALFEEKNKLLREIEDKLPKILSQNMMISISFKDLFKWRKDHRSKVKNYLIECFRDYDNLLKTDESFLFSEFNHHPDFTGISSISVVFGRKLAHTHLYHSSPYMVPEINSKAIQEIVDRKNLKFGQYRKFDLNCLVIYELGLSPSHFDNLESLAKSHYNSDFDKIYYYTHFSKSILDLPVQKTE